MSDVQQHLGKLWALFRKAGIADDLTIIENISALLLEKEGESQGPRAQQLHEKGVNLGDAHSLLDLAKNAAKSPATLLDRHVLFRLPELLPGGRYPTPRHIVSFMHRIADVQAHHHLADLSCGSGGFLVHRPSSTGGGASFGCDISEDWIRLARANSELHGLSTTIQLHPGNALELASPGGPLAGQEFDRILMNPPFGETIDVELSQRVLGQEAGSRSETVLALLALKKLKAGGRAAILVPKTLLSGMTTAERHLRAKWVDETRLEAVISLPRDAFQPFSPIQTHLVMFSKGSPSAHSRTWFLGAARDGYPAGRGRALDLPPPGESDLPFIESVMTAPQEGWTHEQPELKLKRISLQGTSTSGMLIAAPDDYEITRIEKFPPRPDNKPERGVAPFLLVSVRGTRDTTPFLFQLKLDGTEVTNIGSRAGFIKNLRSRLGLKDDQLEDDQPDPFVVIVQEESDLVSAAIKDGQLVGVAIRQARLRVGGYDLRPDRFIQAIKPGLLAESPATLLARFKRNQRALQQQIEKLTFLMELPRVATSRLPPPIHAEAFAPFGSLSLEQQEVWRRVQAKVEDVTDGQLQYKTPIHFSPADIDPASSEQIDPKIQSALDLLEKMGLIVRITIEQPEQQQSLALFRLVTQNESWVDFEPEAGKEDSA